MKHPIIFNKPQIIFLLLLSFLLSVNIFAQTEQTTENKTAETPVAEVETISNERGEVEICDIKGAVCLKRKELLEIVNNQIKDLPKDEYDLKKYVTGFDYVEIGITYFTLGDYKSALSYFNKASEQINHYNTNLFVYRGLVYLKTGKLKAALDDFNIVIRNEPDNELALFGRGEIYFHQRKYDEAFEDYNSTLLKYVRFSKAYFGRGIINLKRGEALRRNKNEFLAAIAFNDALSDFNSVIEIDLNRTPPETYQYRAKVYQALGYDSAAEADLIKFKELSENK